MHIGKTLFAQLTDFLYWTTFTRHVTQYGDNRGVRSSLAPSSIAP